MALESTSPVYQARKLVKWNSTLGTAPRRSRSLTGLNKGKVLDALRSSTSLGTWGTRDDEPTGLTAMGSTTNAVAEEEDNKFHLGKAFSPALATVASASPPPRPKPAPRLWTEPPVTANSLPGLETTIAPRHIVDTMSLSSMSPIITDSLSGSPETRSPVSRYSSRLRDKPLASRRKGSVPDLELGRSNRRTRAIHESNLDSPTIPGHSTRSSRKTPRTPYSKDCPTPRAVASDPQLSETRQEMVPLKTPEWDEKSQRRASSMLLPFNLAPLVVPFMPDRAPPVPPLESLKTILIPLAEPTHEISPTTLKSPDGDHLPPRPPPKSPRTLMRAFPIPKSNMTSSATPSTSHTANSSISSLSPLETPQTSQTAVTWSPLAQALNVVNASSDEGKMLTSTRTPSVPSRSGSPQKETKSETDPPYEAETSSSPRPSARIPTGMVTPQRNRSSSLLDQHLPRKSSLSSIRTQNQHQRMGSDSSLINRGRPMKRGDISIQRGASRGIKLGLINGSFGELPKGLHRGQASSVIPADELNGLRRDAEEEAFGYNILTQKHIAGLNQELRVLDESSEQLRQSISAYREARKAAFFSLRLYIESPGITVSLREHLVKQEAILRDLDASIDECVLKLDVASDRKQTIQDRLWEHKMAVLVMHTAAGDGARLSEEHTPPRSPERKLIEMIAEEPKEELFEGPNKDRDVESITIYADSGVASLLRSIEQELDDIDQLRKHGQ